MLTVFISNPATPTEVWELPVDSYSVEEQLNAIRSGRVSVSYKVLAEMAGQIGTTIDYMLRGGPRHITITDDQYDPAPVNFKGILRNYQFYSSQSEPSTIGIEFADFGVLLSKRVSEEYAFYQDVEAGIIFQTELNKANLIDDTGLTVGTLPTTTQRQRTVEYTNLLDLLTGMSNAKTKGGFDFFIDNDAVVNIYQPVRGSEQPNLVLEERNSLQPQVSGKLAGQLCNKVYVQGGELRNSQGEVTQEATMVIVEDLTSQATWGLHEEYLSATDIATVPFLTQRGQQVLEERAYPISTESISLQHLGDDPDWRSYNVGDWLKVELPAYNIDDFLRVKKRTINWENGIYKCSLSLNREEYPNA